MVVGVALPWGWGGVGVGWGGARHYIDEEKGPVAMHGTRTSGGPSYIQPSTPTLLAHLGSHSPSA